MKLHVISLGAGVQSTTMALMAAHGEITPMPSAAIFSDTGWEPAGVYNHLKWLMSGNVLPFPVHIVNNGNIRDALTTAEPGRYQRKFTRWVNHKATFKSVPWEKYRAGGAKKKVPHPDQLEIPA